MIAKMNSRRSGSWNAALDMQKIDGYVPDKEFKSIIEKEIKREISTDDIIKKLTDKYKR
jgi:hypothetical protein